MAKGVLLTWAGGEHTFLLSIDLLRALQERCDAGPAWVMQRLGSSRWMVDDVIQPIRLGLEGGGLSKEEALKLTRLHVEERPLSESVLTAHAILTHALYAGEDEEAGPGEATGEKRAASASSPVASSDGPSSTAGAA